MLCVVNYGSGNIAAISNICRREHIPFCIANKASELKQGTQFLLPGVGAFDPSMETLESSGMLTALEDEVHARGKPILGICVGMQLLSDGSDEGVRPGLGWIAGRVRKIDTRELTSVPYLPHMGWNSLSVIRPHAVLEGINPDLGFYFLHGYYFDASNQDEIIATVQYGGALPCVVSRGSVVGAQFHPEKSHSNGIRFLKNFVSSY